MGPERRALGVLDPDAQHVLDPVQIHADRNIGGTIDDLAVLPDLDPDRIEIEDWVELFQRPGLPRGDLLEHGVSDVRDRLVREIRAERGGQMVLDIPDRHPAGIEADDHVIQPSEPSLPLGNQARSERPSPVPGDVQRDRSDLGLHGLRRGAVAGVSVLGRVLGALLVAEVAGQLGLQATLEGGLDQRGNEPAITGQLDLSLVDLGEQGIQLPSGLQLLDQVLARGPSRRLLVGHGHDSYRSSRYGLHRPSDTPQ